MPPPAPTSPTPTSPTSASPTSPAPASSADPAPAPRRPLPRPPHSRPGGPAPWAMLPPDERRGITLDRVLAVVGHPGTIGPTPPTPAPALATPAPALATPPPARPAAVLVPLFEEGGETRVVLTVRSDQLHSHTGEVAFPGGRLDAGEGVVEGALREAFEEVGLDPGLATVVGQLTALPTVSSDTVMTPVVATLADRPSLTPNPGEVDRVFDVALADLVADGIFHEEWWSVPDRVAGDGFPVGEFPVWFFAVAGETVWGATARTLVELVCLVLGVDVPTTLHPR